MLVNHKSPLPDAVLEIALAAMRSGVRSPSAPPMLSIAKGHRVGGPLPFCVPPVSGFERHRCVCLTRVALLLIVHRNVGDFLPLGIRCGSCDSTALAIG